MKAKFDYQVGVDKYHRNCPRCAENGEENEMQFHDNHYYCPICGEVVWRVLR